MSQTECRFGKSCHRKDCWFQHSIKRDIDASKNSKSSNSCKFQIISDVHLDHAKNIKAYYDKILNPIAPYLIIAGDITDDPFDIDIKSSESYKSYKGFIDYASSKYKQIFVIAGNHEYKAYLNRWKEKMSNETKLKLERGNWDLDKLHKRSKVIQSLLKIELNNLEIKFGKTVSDNLTNIELENALICMLCLDVKHQINDICESFNTKSKKKVIFLDREFTPEGYLLKDIRIFGSTLWSFIPNDNIIEKSIRTTFNDCNMNDFILCKTFFEKEYLWFKSNIEQCKEIKQLVITHHAPISEGMSNPIYDDNIDRYAFLNNLDEFIFNNKINTWVYGHTHYNNFIDFYGTYIVANQYKSGNINHRYSNTFFIQV
jgi:predicted phosphodiesterase